MSQQLQKRSKPSRQARPLRASWRAQSCESLQSSSQRLPGKTVRGFALVSSVEFLHYETLPGLRTSPAVERGTSASGTIEFSKTNLYSWRNDASNTVLVEISKLKFGEISHMYSYYDPSKQVTVNIAHMGNAKKMHSDGKRPWAQELGAYCQNTWKF